MIRVLGGMGTINQKLHREIRKSFPEIESRFTKERLLEFMNTPIEELASYQLGLGTFIRTKILHPRRILYKLFLQKGTTDKHLMSYAIIREFYNYKKENPSSGDGL